MRKRPWASIFIGTMVATAVFWSDASAIKDRENQGRWNTPVGNGPDKEVPGFLINLGPTGARAILNDKTFTVRYIFPGSPAEGKLKLNDEIAGAFGKPFPKHAFGGEPHGYEGPIMSFGEAIEAAEAKDGKLILNVMRGSETIEVTIQLEPIGAFSPTFPLQCKKSELLRQRALKYLADHSESEKSPPHAKCVIALALLNSGVPQYEAIGKKIIHGWNHPAGAGTWTWDVSYQTITLCEYFLLSGDVAVLPTIKANAKLLRQDQYSGTIVVWKAKETEDPVKIDAAQQLYDGGFGHSPYVSGVGKNGYGPMQFTTILAVMAWQLAERCGVEVDHDGIKSALDFIHRGTNEAGYVAYGGEFTLNNGLIDPVKWRKSTSGTNYVGRVGASLIAHKLSPEFQNSAEYSEKNRKYIKRAYKSLPDGHADSMLGFSWGLLGAEAAEDETVMRTMMDYHKAWFNMMRCHDGSFVVQPGRDYADGGYYISSRFHPTGIMALVFSLANSRLQIQGRNLKNGMPNSKATPATSVATAKPATAEKTQPAKPAPPAAKVPAVPPEVLEQWQARLVKKLDALAKSGAKVMLPMSGQENYLVRGANESSLIVSIQGNELPMPWKQLSLGSRAVLAKSAAREDDTETLLIAAVFQLATGEASEAEDFFAKAALKDAEAVKAARTGLGR